MPCQPTKPLAMKLAFAFIAALAITAFSCSRTTCGPEDGAFGLQGKWKFKEYYVSPGDGSQNWQLPPAGQTYIEFKTNGSFATDIGGWANYSSYQYTYSTITLLPPSGANKLLVYYKIEGTTLTLSPLCFEGCAYRFRRQ